MRPFVAVQAVAMLVIAAGSLAASAGLESLVGAVVVGVAAAVAAVNAVAAGVVVFGGRRG